MKDTHTVVLTWLGPILLVSLAAGQASLATSPTPHPGAAATRLGWYRQHLSMRQRSPWRKLAWHFIGPEIMSGRITDVALPNGRPYTIYVASASGGLWKTNNEGTNWQPIFDDAPSASVGDVAVAPSDPDIVWVGLGEANILRSSMAGTGVYRSTDAGKTWRHMGLAESHHIGRILIHPKDPNRVYVAASGHEWTRNKERGVYRTKNGGKTWQKVLYLGESTGAIDLSMDPSDPDTLYASMWDRMRLKWSDPGPGAGGGIFKTGDGGDSWSELRSGLPPRRSCARIGLALARSRPRTVYALIDNHQVARKAKAGERDSYGRPARDIIKGAEVYRSDDAGRTWRRVSAPAKNLRRLFSTYGWVFGQIRVDPNDAETVWVLGVPLLRSTDGGKTFEQVSYRGLHGDHHALWIDPADSRHLVNGNDGGVNLSYDGGKTWKNIENLGVAQLYNVAYDMAKPFHVYGSIQDNGCWSGPVTHRPGRDPGHDWHRVPGGEASTLALDPSDPNTLYSEGFYGRIQRSTLTPRKTVHITPKAEKGEPPLRGQWLAPFLVSPHNPFVLYHGMQYVFRSMDRGNTWERISPDLTGNDPKRLGNIPFQTITSLCESPKVFGLLYAGTDDGRVWVTRDGGTRWTRIQQGLPRGKWVSRLTASAFHEATVYLTLNGKRDDDFAAYVFRSKNQGRTWTQIGQGIPGGPVNVIREDPRHAKVLYVGTDLGVYVSTDGGATWQVLGQGLPIAFVQDLIVHPRDHLLVAATHGRGMWSVDVGKVRPR